jgi:hypothetical protein
MIGTTRARVSFFMNKFRKLGLIDYNGHLEIHSSLLNVVLHDEPHQQLSNSKKPLKPCGLELVTAAVNNGPPGDAAKAL